MFSTARQPRPRYGRWVAYAAVAEATARSFMDTIDIHRPRPTTRCYTVTTVIPPRGRLFPIVVLFLFFTLVLFVFFIKE